MRGPRPCSQTSFWNRGEQPCCVWLAGMRRAVQCGARTTNIAARCLAMHRLRPCVLTVPAAAAVLLHSRGPPPLDADEIREAVEAALLRRAPTALVRLIGKNAYAR